MGTQSTWGFATEHQNNQHACCCRPKGEEGCGPPQVQRHDRCRHHRPQGQDRLQPCRHPQARCRQQQGRRCQGRHPGQARPQEGSRQGSPQDGLCQGQERRQLQARQGCEAQEGQEGCEEEGRQEASCQEGRQEARSQEGQEARCQEGCKEASCQEGGTQEEARTQEEVNDPAIICTLCT